MFGIRKTNKEQKIETTYDSLSKNGSRAVNEDCTGVCVGGDRKIFVLCDGLGGHGKGDLASQHVVKIMLQCMSQGRSIEESIQYSQDSLMTEQIAMNAQDAMKTTVTCLMIEAGCAQYGHVGDSRIYYFENGKIRQRSMDHSVPQMLANRGDIREEDIRFHEDRSKLIRVMGTPWNAPKYQMSEVIPITPKSTFLMVTDGFWELIDEKAMMKTLKKSSTPQEWLLAMEKIVLQNGIGKNMDNYSAIAVFVR